MSARRLITSFAAPAPGLLSCAVHSQAQGTVLVEVSGEVDQLTTPAFTRALNEQVDAPDNRTVLCDLTAVGFMGVGGLHALIQADEYARERGRELVLLTGRASASVRRLLRITGFDRRLVCRETSPSVVDWVAS